MAEYNELFDLVLEATHASQMNEFVADVKNMKEAFAKAKKEKDLAGMKYACGQFEDIVTDLEREVDELKSNMSNNLMPSILKKAAIVSAAMFAVFLNMKAGVISGLKDLEKERAKHHEMYQELKDRYQPDEDSEEYDKEFERDFRAINRSIDQSANMLRASDKEYHMTGGSIATGIATAALGAGAIGTAVKKNKSDMEKVGITHARLNKAMKNYHKILSDMKKVIAKAEKKARR